MNKGLFRLALIGAVTIPDVMAALGSDNGDTSGAAYQQWFDDNARDLFNDPSLSDPGLADLMAQLPSRVVRKREDVLTGEACYRFRCALLHQARSGHPKGLARVVFVELEP